jgi:aryl-alcohol dehydrogenase-like predicted oxidoreductase
VHDAGIGVFVWSPLAGGFLTGKYTRDNPQGDGGRLTGFDMLPYDRAKGHDLVDVLRGIAKEHNVSPAQIALAWLLTKRTIASVLIGANKMGQLEDNLAAVDVKLSGDEIKKLEELTSSPLPYPHWFTQRVQDQPVMTALGKA